jgi:hypothetical protein
VLRKPRILSSVIGESKLEGAIGESKLEGATSLGNGGCHFDSSHFVLQPSSKTNLLFCSCRSKETYLLTD